jgi:hypothetical protein
MKEHFVIDPLISKRQQLMLATQLCRMVLKVRYLSSFSLLIISHMYLSFLIPTPISSLSSHPMPNHYHTHRSLLFAQGQPFSLLPTSSTASHLLHKARRKHDVSFVVSTSRILGNRDGITAFPMCTLLHTLLIKHARALISVTTKIGMYTNSIALGEQCDYRWKR